MCIVHLPTAPLVEVPSWFPPAAACSSPFFFSCRRLHTRLQGDWCSDVCSSDLAAASFGGGALVQDFRSFDRLLAFDQSSGRVRCEAGITLGKLFDFALRRGLYLAVQPGHPDIDRKIVVYGKNDE